ncbi:MAG: flagellar motor protein MotB [Verrucomicrobiota bacterium]
MKESKSGISKTSVPKEVLVELNGGAWKVAAADFFCAMMALFMVLWIIGQDESKLAESVQLFQNPFRYMESGQSSDSPIDMGGTAADTRETQSGKEESGLGDNSIDYVKSVVQEFLKYLNVETDAEDSPVKVTVTSDGLRLAVFNRDHKPLFEGDSTQFTPWGNLVMQNISWITEQHPMRIRIDAHIGEELEKSENPEYGPWELSSDRANAVRRALIYYALDPKKIERVTGFGAANPKEEDAEAIESVSRIEISMAP